MSDLINSLNQDNTLSKVKLVRTRFDGQIDILILPPALATEVLLTSAENGVLYKSGRIEWGDIIDNWPLGYANYALHNGQIVRPKGYG